MKLPLILIDVKVATVLKQGMIFILFCFFIANITLPRCCNTCQEVRNAYNTKGWAWNPGAIEQCRREGVTDDGSQSKEGCQVFGTLEVNKISGNFHLALGQSFEKHHVHGNQNHNLYLRPCKKKFNDFMPLFSLHSSRHQFE